MQDSRVSSSVNLMRGNGDFRDYRSPSPFVSFIMKQWSQFILTIVQKSAKVLGLEHPEKSSTTLFSRNWEKDGSIIKLADHDDIDHMPLWKRYLFYTTPILVLLSLVSYWTYFVYRIYCVLAAQNAQHKWYPMAWVFIAIEISVAVPTFLHLFMTMFILNPRKRPKLRLTGDDVPDVDVFITCCREETELVLDTVRAACVIDYPMDRFRVVVLDDGRDNDLADACEQLRQTQFPNLYYMAREKIPGKPHHFKAGNLNYGFDEVAKLPGGPAPFAAALDADMIPERQWLRAIMPHMLIDERMALACPPQVSSFFYVVNRSRLTRVAILQRSKRRPLMSKLGFLRSRLRRYQRRSWCSVVHWIRLCSTS
jgi:Glycosyl transferase family 2